MKTGKEVQEYSCRVTYFRYSTVGSSSYAYTMPTKTIEYKGFDNTSDFTRAFVATDESSTYYVDKDLFNSHSEHAKKLKGSMIFKDLDS